MWTRAELKTRAKAVLRISYWKAFLVSLIIAFVGGNTAGGFNFSWRAGEHKESGNLGGNFGPPEEFWPWIPVIIGLILVGILLILAFRILLGYALEVGGRRFFVQAAQSNVDLNALGFAFEKGRYFDIVKAMLWRGFLNFLWYLLLIIPGIVKYYAYMMVPYILTDNPNIGYKRAVDLSVQMTDGQKFDMWVLDLSFLGWYLLGMLAFFVGTFFVMPYENATKAELYLELRQKAINRGYTSYEELMV